MFQLHPFSVIVYLTGLLIMVLFPPFMGYLSVGFSPIWNIPQPIKIMGTYFNNGIDWGRLFLMVLSWTIIMALCNYLIFLVKNNIHRR